MPPIPSRRLAVAALLAAAVWVLPAALAGSVGTGGLAGSASSVVDAALGSSCASAAGTIHVGVVIDFGGAKPLARSCASPAEKSDGFKALTAAGHTFRVSSAGLLCAIDDYPGGTECGKRTATGYRYWSYWHGGSSWSYSTTGPAGVRLQDGSVEGWHFVEGGGNPNDPPPGASPASPCPASPDPTTTSTTAAPSGGAGGPGAGGGSSGGGAAPSPTSSAPPGGSVDGSTTTTVPDAAVGLSGGDGGATDTTGADRSDDTASGDVALGANAPASSPGHGSGVPIGLIVVAVAIVGLGGSALFRWRTRTES